LTAAELGGSGGDVVYGWAARHFGP
jgi:hypothetical protein